MVLPPGREEQMRPDPERTTLQNNIPQITEMLQELILRPRRDLAKWARVTKQTPNVKIGYPGQHLASLVTGVEGERTGARGHDLRDGSEVKSCSRVDQLDKCNACNAAVARIESSCPRCSSTNIRRNNDSKWLLAVKSEEELRTLLDDVPRVVFILSDYPNYDEMDWNTLQFQVFEIWPQHDRHRQFSTLMENYFNNIFLPHIERNPRRTPAPKNFWPYSFQFYMCNPVRTFHCIIEHALEDANINVLEYIDPLMNRENVEPVPMPLSVLNRVERRDLQRVIGHHQYRLADQNGLTEDHRTHLTLRDTDHANPQARLYRRGIR